MLEKGNQVKFQSSLLNRIHAITWEMPLIQSKGIQSLNPQQDDIFQHHYNQMNYKLEQPSQV